MHGRGHVWWGCAWQGGVCGGGPAWQGVCMVGACMADTMRYGDMVNERAVRILLECILVRTKIEN